MKDLIPKLIPSVLVGAGLALGNFNIVRDVPVFFMNVLRGFSIGANPILDLSDRPAIGTSSELPQAPSEAATILGVLATHSTVSAETINSVLAEYRSPAMGTGNDWIEASQKYPVVIRDGSGETKTYIIDPAYALAFFIHESGAGTSPAWAGLKSDGTSTHNVGNIICAGYASCYGRFRDYPDWQTGIEDWYRLIAVEYIRGRGINTVEQIIPIYAPSVENDVSGYINVVNNLVSQYRQREKELRGTGNSYSLEYLFAPATSHPADLAKLRREADELKDKYDKYPWLWPSSRISRLIQQANERAQSPRFSGNPRSGGRRGY